MCGIAGIISNNREQAGIVLEEMISAVSHRGPDGQQQWCNADGSVQLAHRRLSVIDLSERAAQPMHYLGRYTIVHNGEVYNYVELKQELIQKGYAFQTASDTEVILAAYDCWGSNCLQQFDGMFAFAIWDEKEQLLFAARDRFGQKPFYYALDERQGRFQFASEIKAFRKSGLLSGTNDRQLLLYLSNGLTYDPYHPDQTFYSSIFQLPPAHFMEVRPNAAQEFLSIGAWWDIDKECQSSVSDDEAVEKFLGLFTTAVKRVYRSDVSVGTCLSGGLDSSSIVAIASGLKAESNSYRVFSAMFPGFEKDESKYSAAVANQFGLQQFTVSPSGEDLEAFFKIHDEPLTSASAYAQFRVFQLAKENGIKVLIDGQGADEMLGGYYKYVHWYLQELLMHNRKSFRKELKALRANGIPFQWSWKNYVAARFPVQASVRLEKKALAKVQSGNDFNQEWVEANVNGAFIYKPLITKLNDILYFNSTQGGLQELLRVADQNSMANGCEVRLPFLHHPLVEFVFSLPSEFKIRNGYTKWVLRKSVSSLLPDSITWRKDKVGFEPPQEKWMQGTKVQEMIRHAREKLVQKKILSPSVLNKKIQPHDAYAAESIDWRYLSAGYWLQQ